MIALIVPVYKNFAGFANLMRSVDHEIIPIIIPNWECNTGVSKGWNAGLKLARIYDAEISIIANDDVSFHAGTIRKLSENIDRFDIISGTNRRDESSVDGFDNHPDFSLFAVKTEQFIERFGFFDENFSPAYFEDNDMARRVLVSGGSYGRMLNAGMFHVGSVTQNMDGPVVTSPMFEANRQYYIRKWGGQPLQEKFTHPFNDESKTIKDW